MSESIYLLNDYPIKECYNKCWEYMYQRIRWSEVSDVVKSKFVAYIDVSDVIELFPCLELDENYSLICYVSREYHGLWGRVAAIQCGQAIEPNITEKEGFFHGPEFELPEKAAPPMEAIYNDGTPEGYFEALLCEQLLHAIPYAQFERKNWDQFIIEHPSKLRTHWNVRIDIPDWRPRAILHERKNFVIIACRYVFENGFGSSDGRDKIYLTEYSFCDRLSFYHSFGRRRDRMYHGIIDDDKRFGEARRCCVSLPSSILIAEQKEYR